MTRLNLALHGPEKAVNFAQGFPDFPPSPEIVEAAHQALDAGYHQYATTWGAPQLRQAIARKQSQAWDTEIDPDRQVTVTCGATESMMAAMLAAVDPRDEVVIFEPFYENYGPDCILSGATPRYVTLHAPDWRIDPQELRRAFTKKTRAIVVNTPHNPTGKVFSEDELLLISDLCREHGAIAITDEIYEHLVYEGRHLSLATLPGMAERTITISGASKTYSVTGWRIGWLIAPAGLTAGIRKVHDFLTVGAAHPLQVAVAQALEFPPSFYDALLEEYRERRDAMVAGLRAALSATSYPRRTTLTATPGAAIADSGAPTQPTLTPAAPPTMPAAVPTPHLLGPPPGLNFDPAFWSGQLDRINQDQHLLGQLQWRLTAAVTDWLRAYVNQVLIPAVEHAENH